MVFFCIFCKNNVRTIPITCFVHVRKHRVYAVDGTLWRLTCSTRVDAAQCCSQESLRWPKLIDQGPDVCWSQVELKAVWPKHGPIAGLGSSCPKPPPSRVLARRSLRTCRPPCPQQHGSSRCFKQIYHQYRYLHRSFPFLVTGPSSTVWLFFQIQSFVNFQLPLLHQGPPSTISIHASSRSMLDAKTQSQLHLLQIHLTSWSLGRLTPY